MNFPNSPIVGQLYSWQDFVWEYVGNNKWDLILVRGRGALLTFFVAYISYSIQNGDLTRGSNFFSFDAT